MSENKPLADPTSLPDSSNGLPSPQEFPAADVLVYDGRCKFCTGQMKKVRWFDGKNRIAYVSLHDPWVSEQFPDLTYERMMEQMYLIPAGPGGYLNVRHGGVAAVRYLTRCLPRLWIFAPLLHLPFSLPIWQWGYNLVAKYRYKIAGKTGGGCDDGGTCNLHFDQKK